ncbi:hypothetical protein ABZP36_035695 [Zizania latifolia]
MRSSLSLLLPRRRCLSFTGSTSSSTRGPPPAQGDQQTALLRSYTLQNEVGDLRFRALAVNPCLPWRRATPARRNTCAADNLRIALAEWSGSGRHLAVFLPCQD